MAFVTPTITAFPSRRRTSPGAIMCQTAEPKPEYRLAPDEIAVRFINTPSGKEVVAAAKIGDPLLRVGDSIGVYIPRACQSGLCGSCTCDILDSTSETGVQTVRACQTGAVIPDGGEELVVDVARMKSFKKRDPMARFENLDTEYVARAPPKPIRKTGTWLETRDCQVCGSEGDVECYNCDGSGTDGGYQCVLCAGSGQLRCAACQGTGTVNVRRPHECERSVEEGTEGKPQPEDRLNSMLVEG